MSLADTVNYPKIQREASRYSRFYQKCASTLIIANLSVLVLAAGIDVVKFGVTDFPYPKTSLILLSLLIANLSAKLGLDKKWYAARSLSETVKSLTWRFSMQAVPFDGPIDNRKSLLLDRIESACHESNKLAGSKIFALCISDNNITIKTEYSSLQEKISTYIAVRMRHQLQWYKVQARRNKIKSSLFFLLFVMCNCGALAFSALQEAGHGEASAINGLLVACATALIGWIESKKYKELSAAYTLTKDEIASLAYASHDISNQYQLADFVKEAESLFSREHTQWAAKRGYTSPS